MEETEYKKCLLCYKTMINSFNDSSSSTIKLSDQDTVVFVLRNLLAIPRPICVRYLKQYGNPSTWVSWCSNCRSIIEDAQLVSSELKKLDAKLKSLQELMKTEIFQSDKIFRNSKTLLSSSTLDIVDQIRDYVLQNIISISNSNDKSISGSLFSNADSSPDYSDISSLDLEDELFNPEVVMEEGLEDPLDTDIPQLGSQHETNQSAHITSESSDFESTSQRRLSSSKRKISTRKLPGRTKLKKAKHTINSSKKSNITDRDVNKKSSRRKSVKTRPINSLRNKLCSTKRNNSQPSQQSSTEEDVPLQNSLKSKTNITNRVTRMKNQAPKTFNCRICNTNFLRRRILQLHIKTNHAIAQPLQCKICNEGLKGAAGLWNHMVRYHPDQQFSNSKRKKRYNCEECGKETSSKVHLNYHRRQHAIQMQFECDVCNLQFRSITDLDDHRNQKHPTLLENEPYKCRDCGKTFTEPILLRTHESTVHKKSNEHICPVCQSGFSAQHILKRHLKIHTGEKPEECQECHKRFASKTGLKRHTMTHTGERPFLCPTCGKSFITNIKLKTHELIHSGEKNFCCQLCDKRFATRNNLYVHMRSHNKKQTNHESLSEKESFGTHGGIVEMREDIEQPTEAKGCAEVVEEVIEVSTTRDHLDFSAFVLFPE